MSDTIDATPVATGQEAIQMVSGDYLATLERMVADGRKRHDPTLAIALSIDMLGLLVAEVRKARSRSAFHVSPIAQTDYRVIESDPKSGADAKARAALDTARRATEGSARDGG